MNYYNLLINKSEAIISWLAEKGYTDIAVVIKDEYFVKFNCDYGFGGVRRFVSTYYNLNSKLMYTLDVPYETVVEFENFLQTLHRSLIIDSLLE